MPKAPQQLPSGRQSTGNHGKVACGAIADTPNYNLIAYRASLAHSSKGYRAIMCRYIQMTEQLRLLYQLQGNCSHSAETGTLKTLSSPQRGMKRLPASFLQQCPLARDRTTKQPLEKPRPEKGWRSIVESGNCESSPSNLRNHLPTPGPVISF